jgi:D-glycero-alpha-D-manno-heptose-7-phosphate kinase
MIITRAPLRISFVGGGTDIKDFYEKYPGRVISSTIDKHVYTAINYGRLLDSFVIKYMETETAKHPSEFKHTRFRETMLRLNVVEPGLEIASFADLPGNTGLGSSSSFTVALLKAINAHHGVAVSKQQAAELACEIEIDILKEPIGKQDQYAAAYGGFNVFQFNPDGTVDVDPIFIDYKVRANLEDHVLLFFTGITRSASSVLSVQKVTMAEKFETYKQMSDSVLVFKDLLQEGNVRGMAEMLHEGWERKKSLAGAISSSAIDELYTQARELGAWGGKILGAGGGGCLFFIAPPEKHAAIGAGLRAQAEKLGLEGFKKIDFDFSQSGADVLFNSLSHHA